MQPLQSERHDPYYEPPPRLEYIGVAPVWRTVGVLALIALALLLCVTFLLLIALAGAGTRTAAISPPPMVLPPPVMAAGAAGADVADPLAEEALPAGAAPLPDRQDLRPPGVVPVPGEEDDGRAAAVTPRGDFLSRGHRLIDCPSDVRAPVLVSGDGLNLAYHNGTSLMAGSPGSVNAINEADIWGGARFGGQPGGVPGVVGAGMLGPGMGMATNRLRDGRPVLCGWSVDGGTCFWTNGNGRVLSFELTKNLVFRTNVRGEAACPIHTKGMFFVVRTRLNSKGLDNAADATEAALVDATTGNDVRVLFAGPDAVRVPAAAKDGSKVAFVSDRGAAKGDKVRWRVFVLDLDDVKAEPKPVSPFAERLDSVGWANDGKALVYGRTQAPPPVDHRAGVGSSDLFELDLATGKETRLSRGGGFTSPNIDAKDDLYYLVETPQPGGTTLVQLMRMPLKDLRAFHAEEAAVAAKTTEQWQAAIAAAFEGSGVAADGSGLTPAAAAKLDAAFRKASLLHRKREVSATAAGLEDLRHDALSAGLDAAGTKRLELLLGVVEGEYLRRRNEGSNWHLGKAMTTTAVTGESLFGYAVNPFRPLSRDAKGPTLAELVERAAGRPLVLTGDAALAKEALAKLDDARIGALTKLLEAKKGDEADAAARDLVKGRDRNIALLQHVAELLYRHGRTATAAELLQKPNQLPPEARLYNLLGLALLPEDRRAAATAFQNALRCDLKYGPAYLNLAQAYWELGQAAEARTCLRHYLRVAPNGAFAADARRRLMTFAEPPPRVAGGQ